MNTSSFPTASASTEGAARKLDPSYRRLFERNPLPMWVYDVKTLRMLAVNDAALAIYGYSKPEFVGLTLPDIEHEDDLAQLTGHLELPPDQPGAQEFGRHRQRNGDLIEVETVTETLEFDGIQARMMLVRDVTEQRRTERAQRDLARRLTSTLESITDAFFTLDRNWRFTYCNTRAQELLRSKGDELLGCEVWEKFPETAGSAFQFECERAMAEGKTTSFEAFHEPWAVWLEVDAYPSAQGLAVYFRDVTEKHVAEQRLLEERETLTAVINSATDAIISIDADGLIKIFNPGAERVFRRTRASMLGQSVEALLPDRFREAHAQQRLQFSAAGGASRMMGLGLVKGMRSDGQEIDLESTITQVTVQQQKMLIASMRDVTDRVAVDAEFQQSRAQLSDLTQKLMTQERTLVKRLAQVLHDQLGQTMATIRMCHDTIITLQKEKTSSGVDQLQAQMGALISQAIRQVRQVLIDLRPPLLEEQGLAAALDNELRNRSLTRPQLEISIEVPPKIALMRWPIEVEYSAFMVAREAVENAFRHSGASFVSVRLEGTDRSLQLEVADNGVGITAGATPRTGHLGILGMHERAHAIGATVSLNSGEDEGTLVSFSWTHAP